MILTLRTDNPEAEIGLYDGHDQLMYKKWQAHRELSATIHLNIKGLLDSLDKNWGDIDGIVYFKGPGSFTGLRIGASLVNALASSNHVSVSNQNGENWISLGIDALKNKQAEPMALPEYGSDPHITAQKK